MVRKNMEYYLSYLDRLSSEQSRLPSAIAHRALSHSSKFERCGPARCEFLIRTTGERKLKNIATYRRSKIGYWVTL